LHDIADPSGRPAWWIDAGRPPGLFPRWPAVRVLYRYL